MSFVVNQKIGSKTLSGFYRKVETEGDASRFVSVESGYQQYVAAADLVSEAPLDAGPWLVSLDFTYSVGSRQLLVCVAYSESYFNILAPTDGFPSTLTSYPRYEEVDQSTVRILGSTKPARVLVIMPHTATPATSREKIVVNDQMDNTAIELVGDGDGVLMRSPNGSKWLLRIDDSGNLVTESR